MSLKSLWLYPDGPTAAVCVLILLIGGCVEQRIIHDPWADLRAQSDRSVSPRRDGQLFEQIGWAILLGEFSGRDRKRQAQQFTRRVAREGSVPQTWVRDEGNKVRVYRGRYLTPDGFAAQEDLRQARLVILDDTYPFRDAELVSLSESEGQISADPLNLKQYRDMEMYSLQIAVYDDAFGSKFREAAEQAARVLRSDAVEAYYYHGPHRSMITVGLIPYEQAFDSQVGRQDTYSQYVRQMQRKFPYNLLNGRTIIEKRGNNDKRQQPSFLVPIR